VIPPTFAELTEAGYAAQVRDIAPEVLLGRDQELAELVRFCAGDEPYQWWQAQPWAGKSALMAWFVLHPPEGVRIASFFVTRRLAGQSDSAAFNEAMVEQLAAIVGDAMSPAPNLAGWERERLRLLEKAAETLDAQGGRLVVVVDGLDEDQGCDLASGRPSIASLLPRRPPAGVRVILASRPHPGIPIDVPVHHPLRDCVPRLLAPSPYAEDLRLQAKRELVEHLRGGDKQRIDIIGFITASGGGLTLRELSELMECPGT
jgi:hypothetical protein